VYDFAMSEGGSSAFADSVAAATAEGMKSTAVAAVEGAMPFHYSK
jgi:hypothetical protein